MKEVNNEKQEDYSTKERKMTKDARYENIFH
jgi:hypothetical protein